MRPGSDEVLFSFWKRLKEKYHRDKEKEKREDKKKNELNRKITIKRENMDLDRWEKNKELTTKAVDVGAQGFTINE
jgi:hypothetical protein